VAAVQEPTSIGTQSSQFLDKNYSTTGYMEQAHHGWIEEGVVENKRLCA
jgi:hypothetical protein